MQKKSLDFLKNSNFTAKIWKFLQNMVADAGYIFDLTR